LGAGEKSGDLVMARLSQFKLDELSHHRLCAAGDEAIRQQFLDDGATAIQCYGQHSSPTISL
jgi:hypothetical protein